MHNLEFVNVKCVTYTQTTHVPFRFTGSVIFIVLIESNISHVELKYGNWKFIFDCFGENGTCCLQRTLTCSFKLFCTSGQHSLKYFSLYFGNRVAKELSAANPFGLSSGVNLGSFQPAGTSRRSSEGLLAASVR